jgi:hypothetical protein
MIVVATSPWYGITASIAAMLCSTSVRMFESATVLIWSRARLSRHSSTPNAERMETTIRTNSAGRRMDGR